MNSPNIIGKRLLKAGSLPKIAVKILWQKIIFSISHFFLILIS